MDKTEKSKEEFEKEQAIRNKKWAECVVEEKLEKLRWELMEMRGFGQRIYTLDRKFNSLFKHSHNEKGDLVVPLEPYFGEGTLTAGVMRRDNLA